MCIKNHYWIFSNFNFTYIYFQGFKNAIKPLESWGPALEENKKGKYAADNEGFELDLPVNSGKIEQLKNGASVYTVDDRL